MARMQRGRAWRLAFLLVAGSMAYPAAALDVVVTRHAETLANVTKDYSAFNQRHFTEAGTKQIAALTAALDGIRFDAILVSPAYRTLKTVEPYLKQSGQSAEIWPELDECCWQLLREGATSPPGLPILLETEQRPLFFLRADAPVVVPGNESYDEGVRRIRAAAEAFRARWSGTEAVVLVVAHQHTGSRLVETLLGEAPEGRYRIENARFTHLREEGGRFVLVELNGADVRVEQAVHP